MADSADGGRKRVHVYISGRVQGVLLRDATREKAGELGLTGWVKNLPDGRVEAVFEGPAREVEEMTGWCEDGPPHAAVENVETEFEKVENLRGFEVF